MFHKSELAKFGGQFPHDSAGYVPVHGDSWRQMQFDNPEMDPEAPGISAEEKARRLEYLDKQWWPQVLAQVNDEHERLKNEHGESYISHWQRIAKQDSPEDRPGIEVV